MSLDHCIKLSSIPLYNDALCFFLVIAWINTSVFLASMSTSPRARVLLDVRVTTYNYGFGLTFLICMH